MGRRDQPRVGRDLAGAADPRDHLALEHAQQLGLQRQRHVADLVEEQRAAVGGLEEADLALVGAGERAALVAEQLALEQALGQRRAVELDQRPVAAAGALVDRLAHQLLADPGLAEDQHGHRGVGDPLDQRVDPLHRGVEHDRRALGRRGARHPAGAQAGAQHADQGLDGGAVVGAQRGRRGGLDVGGAREVEQALDRRRAVLAAELGQDDQVVVARVLGDQVHRPDRALDLIEDRVAGDPEQRDGDRPVVAHRAIDLGGEPGLAGGDVGDRAGPPQAGGHADHGEDRPDADLVAGHQPARALDLVAVDPGAVAAPEIFDLDHVAGAPHPGVHARHLVGVERDRRTARPSECDVDPFRKIDHARTAVVDRDHEERARRRRCGQFGRTGEGLWLVAHSFVRIVHSHRFVRTCEGRKSPRCDGEDRGTTVAARTAPCV